MSRVLIPVSRNMCAGLRRIFPLQLLTLLLCFQVWEFNAAAENTSREYTLKAAFLLNFARFTEWPTNAFATTNSPLVIGILGNDPFGKALEQIVHDQSMGGHHFTIEHCNNLQTASHCHILFISQSEAGCLGTIIKNLRDKPILTVSDLQTLVANDICIRFKIHDNKIRFIINTDALKKANLAVSSKLLRLAEIVPRSNQP